MESSMTRLELFGNLGYRVDPYKGKHIQTGDLTRVSRITRMAVASHAMMAVIGERGCGKTQAINAALKAEKCTVVTVLREDQENLRAREIKETLLAKLAKHGESMKRGGVASLAQLRRVVGQAVVEEKRQIVVVIEEAQRLHPNTLKSLKTLREMEWAGHTELFTIILVAQSNPMSRPGVSEVSLRSDAIRMNGLSADEAANYVEMVLGRHFDEQAITALAQLPEARNYLELQGLTVALLNHALADGREIVTDADVTAVAGAQAAEPLSKRPSRVKQAPETVSGKVALASVLSRRAGSSEEREVINAKTQTGHE